MPLRIDKIKKCCLCIRDLKVAAAIIAVLGIVTSPAVSWAIVRHSYVIRVSCFISTSETRPDVIDVNLNNILSFGFGANAGLGSSCLQPKPKTRSRDHDIVARTASISSPKVAAVVKYCGWVVLIGDLVFLGSSVNFLVRMFRGGDKNAVVIFLWAGVVSVCLSFIYGLLYVAICISSGSAFPIYELSFCFIDLIAWVYFLIVVHSYRRRGGGGGGGGGSPA